jgi:hypothetical protein
MRTRQVKKPKHPLPTEITAPLSVFLVLISTWLCPILTRKFRALNLSQFVARERWPRR